MRCQQCGHQRLAWEAGPEEICPKCGARYEAGAPPKFAWEEASSTASEPTKRCPYCGEEILSVAIKCKHCGSDLQRRGVKKRSPPIAEQTPAASTDNRGAGITGLILAAIVGFFVIRAFWSSDSAEVAKRPAESDRVIERSGSSAATEAEHARRFCRAVEAMPGVCKVDADQRLIQVVLYTDLLEGRKICNGFKPIVDSEGLSLRGWRVRLWALEAPEQPIECGL